MVLVPLRDARTIGILGGFVFAVLVLAWIFSAGVYFSSQDLLTIAMGFGYSSVGMVLIGGVPLYLLARFSLISPVFVTIWLLGDTAYQWLYGTHLHPLSSYLIVWPLLLGVAVLPVVVEAPVRIGLERSVDRFGLRSLV